MIDPELAAAAVDDFDERLDQYMEEWEAELRRRAGKPKTSQDDAEDEDEQR